MVQPAWTAPHTTPSRTSGVAGLFAICRYKYSKFTSFFQRKNHVVAPFIGNGVISNFVPQISEK